MMLLGHEPLLTLATVGLALMSSVLKSLIDRALTIISKVAASREADYDRFSSACQDKHGHSSFLSD